MYELITCQIQAWLSYLTPRLLSESLRLHVLFQPCGRRQVRRRHYITSIGQPPAGARRVEQYAQPLSCHKKGSLRFGHLRRFDSDHKGPSLATAFSTVKRVGTRLLL